MFERMYTQLHCFRPNRILFLNSNRSVHSIVAALLEISESWAFNIDRGNSNAVVFLDLKKPLIPC